MGNLYLLLTIISETAAVVFMKLSGGFLNKWYSVLAVVFYGIGFIFLTLALKYLPAGIANAIWAGASTILVAVMGVIIFHERFSTVQFISMILIVAGLVGLNWKV